MKWPLLLNWFLLLHSRILGATRDGCEFPERWRGSWFQSGVEVLVAVNESAITSKGHCIDADGDKFLIGDRADNCYRCIAIHEKHPNVLQYKETYCTTDRTSLPQLCLQLTGDAALYSLFRSGAAPAPCPIQGPLIFSYSRGQAECNSPMSSAETCTQNSRLLLRYQACPDVPATESTVDELECLAAWKEGSTQYFVARRHGVSLVKDEDRYRCFVYAKTSKDSWSLAQSGDATCSGLLSATEGAWTLNMRQIPVPEGCRYPSWIVSYGTWNALDMVSRLLVSEKTLTILDRRETRLVCHSVVSQDVQDVYAMVSPTKRRVMLVAKATRGCENGYVCVVFHRRDEHLIEMQKSDRWSQQPEDACRLSVFNPLVANYTTFVTSNPIYRQCPYLGRYKVASATRSHVVEEQLGTNGDQHGNANVDPMAKKVRATTTPLLQQKSCHQTSVHGLEIGCISPDRMEFATSCKDEVLSVYWCHGTWVENGTAYLVASTEAGRYCLAYSTTATTDLSVTAHLATCPRPTHPHHRQHAWQVNLTAYVQCGDTSTASSWTSSRSSTFFHILLSMLFSRYVTR